MSFPKLPEPDITPGLDLLPEEVHFQPFLLNTFSKKPFSFDTSSWNYSWEIEESAAELLDLAFTEPLTLQQQDVLHSKLQSSFSQNYLETVMREPLAGLVNFNLETSELVLQQIFKKFPEKAPALQDAVAQLPVNLCSIDLVVRLIKAETLTSDWLRLFVIRSLVSCENVKEDRETMERQVSMLVKSVLKYSVLTSLLLMVELKTWCLQFSKNAQVASLYKNLLELEKNNK